MHLRRPVDSGTARSSATPSRSGHARLNLFRPEGRSPFRAVSAATATPRTRLRQAQRLDRRRRLRRLRAAHRRPRSRTDRSTVGLSRKSTRDDQQPDPRRWSASSEACGTHHRAPAFSPTCSTSLFEQRVLGVQSRASRSSSRSRSSAPLPTTPASASTLGGFPQSLTQVARWRGGRRSPTTPTRQAGLLGSRFERRRLPLCRILRQSPTTR